uniref:Uncharacterized protein n=1 Tax=Rhizophora mucronata TaxID=61149 RepID=A0A2P2NW23_RHIMU
MYLGIINVHLKILVNPTFSFL